MMYICNFNSITRSRQSRKTHAQKRTVAHPPVNGREMTIRSMTQKLDPLIK